MSWIGVDLDGTLAEYHEWRGDDVIGNPIKPMLERVSLWLKAGVAVKIMTARPVHPPIKAWCLKYLGVELPVTNSKDFEMLELWDDRAVRVRKNTGEQLSESSYGPT